jgi:hypothetical protein
MTSMLSSGAATMPPTMGAAMRVMTSEPVPWPSRIGSKPAITTATVIAFGLTRMTAPLAHGRQQRLFGGRRAGGKALLRGVLKVDQHHNPELRCYAGEGDEADSSGH